MAGEDVALGSCTECYTQVHSTSAWSQAAHRAVPIGVHVQVSGVVLPRYRPADGALPAVRRATALGASVPGLDYSGCPFQQRCDPLIVHPHDGLVTLLVALGVTAVVAPLPAIARRRPRGTSFR
jgi:hypothetical protein